MPKQKITREMVVDAAFQLAREGGMERVLVKDIAACLGCSVQPIYSCFRNMEELRRAVERRTADFMADYLSARLEPDNLFQSTGRAHVQFARDEPELFKIFILRRREGASTLDELYRQEASPDMAGAIAAQLGLDEAAARQLHLDLLIYTVGLGTIFSVTTPGIPADEILARQERAYQAFLNHARGETGHDRL